MKSIGKFRGDVIAEREHAGLRVIGCVDDRQPCLVLEESGRHEAFWFTVDEARRLRDWADRAIAQSGAEWDAIRSRRAT